MRVLFATALFLLGGCQPNAQMKMTVMQQRQLALDRIADGCAMPHTSFKLISENQVAIQGLAGASDEAFACFLTQLKKSKLPVNLGFVGRETYSDESK